MPVFAAAGRRGRFDELTPDDEDLQRIGTAWRNDDGSYLVSLTAVPLNGELLIRPPRLGEAIYPPHGRERVESHA